MYTREQAIDSMLAKDPTCPPEILQALVLIDVKFFGFDGQTHEGQIVVHQDLEKDVKDLFGLMFDSKFPVQEVTPIVKYIWDDEASMSANNSSGFNYRKVAGEERLSLHSLGRAIDINPQINPWVRGDVTQPTNASYNVKEPGTLYAGHQIVELMRARGWEWGGNWKDYKDYQHFQKAK